PSRPRRRWRRPVDGTALEHPLELSFVDEVGVAVDADDLPDLPWVAEALLHVRMHVVAGDDGGDECPVSRRVAGGESLYKGDRVAGIPRGLECAAETPREIGTRFQYAVELEAANIEAAGRRHLLRAGDQVVGDARKACAEVRAKRPGGHAGTRWSARRSTRRSAKRKASAQIVFVGLTPPAVTKTLPSTT